MTSNVRSMKWHQECLANQREHVKRLEIALEHQMSELSRARHSLVEYSYLIDDQIQKGKTKFDRNLVGKKRKRQEKI